RIMSKILALAIIMALGAWFFLARNSSKNVVVAPPIANQSQNQNQIKLDSQIGNVQVVSEFQSPLDRAGERVTKKPFGKFVTPQNSPVQPEKFYGYHTGADFEIFPEELNADVSIHALCSGKIEVKKTATGYGGVVVENCTLNGQPITVVYGHLKLASVKWAIGDDLKTGDVIGSLGAAYSAETGGERKHLHLGFHKGTVINILGYVQNKAELSGWIDPCLFVCNN
ncbi:MAG: hypothetical protein COX30_00305, partial [Candidatus Moranbacteria bacterium CG23_combo_of_CG06-09_8_20_14_all_39_10]